MPKISIELEIEENQISDHLNETEIIAATPRSLGATPKTIKKHHGTRKYEKIKIESYKSIQFSTGNPKVQICKGIIHLYKEKSCNDNKSDSLCLMSVPTVISCAELVNFCSPFSNLINHIRVLSSSKPGLYLSIIKFIDDLTAQQFFELNHGKLINPDNRHSICNLAYVHSVTYLPTNKGGFLANDHQTELPNCPICLERMDESLEGILTVLCDHSFHAECLMKWPDIKCPVCRYIQSPTSSETMTCSECDNKNDLWMCLICGNLACGRYENKHAFKHFEETGHTFSLKIGSSVVWDYAGDNYVHRLISCDDGKPVECINEYQDSLDNKTESLKLEYNHLLTFQLANQRDFFENKIHKIIKDHQQEVFRNSERHKKEIEKLNSNFTKKLKVANKVDPKKLEEEKIINISLSANQDSLKEIIKTLEKKYTKLETESTAKISQLQEEIHDLMAHFEMSANIQSLDKNVKDEISQGNIIIKGKNQKL